MYHGVFSQQRLSNATGMQQLIPTSNGSFLIRSRSLADVNEIGIIEDSNDTPLPLVHTANDQLDLHGVKSVDLDRQLTLVTTSLTTPAWHLSELTTSISWDGGEESATIICSILIYSAFFSTFLFFFSPKPLAGKKCLMRKLDFCWGTTDPPASFRNFKNWGVGSYQSPKWPK